MRVTGKHVVIPLFIRILKFITKYLLSNEKFGKNTPQTLQYLWYKYLAPETLLQ